MSLTERIPCKHKAPPDAFALFRIQNTPNAPFLTVSAVLRILTVSVVTFARLRSGIGCLPLLFWSTGRYRRFVAIIPIPSAFAACSALPVRPALNYGGPPQRRCSVGARKPRFELLARPRCGLKCRICFRAAKSVDEGRSRSSGTD